MPTETTTLNRKWAAKIIIVMVVVFGFGMWALLDALVIYPRRGLEDASYKQWRYLERAQRSGVLNTASIVDPAPRQGTLAARRAELSKAMADAVRYESLAGGSSPESRQAGIELRKIEPLLVDAAALEWLDSLRTVGRLDKNITTMPQPGQTLTELQTKWRSAPQPKALAPYDLPLQWFLVIGCVGATAYMLLFVLVPAMRAVYTWDPGEKRLTLPGGKSLVPGDIAEFDKRKWDKFFIFLHLKDSAGGGQLKLDLLRHAKLEGWILEMEHAAFPDSAPPPPHTFKPTEVAPAGEPGNP